MKRLKTAILLVLTCCLFFAACKKNETEATSAEAELDWEKSAYQHMLSWNRDATLTVEFCPGEKAEDQVLNIRLENICEYPLNRNVMWQLEKNIAGQWYVLPYREDLNINFGVDSVIMYLHPNESYCFTERPYLKYGELTSGIYRIYGVLHRWSEKTESFSLNTSPVMAEFVVE